MTEHRPSVAKPGPLIERPTSSMEAIDFEPEKRPWWQWWNRRRAVKALLLALLVTWPWIAWRILPARTLGVVVIDKTRPLPDVREHSSIMWWLDHRKLRAPDGAVPDAERDYVGYHPTEKRGDTLSAKDLVGAQLAYIADTYGVYSSDYAQNDAERLKRSVMYYGGLTVSEVEALAAFRTRGGAIVAEFNSIATPVYGSPASGPAGALLGAQHAGWLGKWYADLGSPDEVPAWMRNQWYRYTKRTWDFTGEGLVVFSELDDRIVVIPAIDYGSELPIRMVVDSAKHPLMRGVVSGTPYWYWFSGLTVARGSSVIASYVLDVSPAAKAWLRAANFPERFPAIVTRSGGPLVLVVSGELADIGGAPPDFLHTWGLDWMHRAGVNLVTPAGDPARRFWNVTIPVWDAVADSLQRAAKR